MIKLNKIAQETVFLSKREWDLVETEIERLRKSILDYVESITCRDHSLCSLTESMYEGIYEREARKHFSEVVDLPS